ncbi:hypothetical protein [Shimia sp. MIT1388]|uniref:hypothetical protein n=1 Tax=Shimia sp. MIT1388 TaxID=3096992 RepID=UPI003999EEEE
MTDTITEILPHKANHELSLSGVPAPERPYEVRWASGKVSCEVPANIPEEVLLAFVEWLRQEGDRMRAKAAKMTARIDQIEATKLSPLNDPPAMCSAMMKDFNAAQSSMEAAEIAENDKGLGCPEAEAHFDAFVAHIDAAMAPIARILEASGADPIKNRFFEIKKIGEMSDLERQTASLFMATEVWRMLAQNAEFQSAMEDWKPLLNAMAITVLNWLALCPGAVWQQLVLADLLRVAEGSVDGP